MKNKSFYLGVLVGLIIGFVPPSVAYYSSSSIKEMRSKAAQNMLYSLRGERIRNIVNPK